MITQQSVREALSKVKDPGLKKNIIVLQMVKEVAIEQGRVRIVLALPLSAAP